MTDKEIILILLKSKKAHKIYKKLSVKNLCEIMTFLEKKLKTIKGNWSLRLYNQFIEKNKNLKYIDLKFFYYEYANRKKEIKNFELFVNLIKKKEVEKWNEWRNKKITLVDKDKTKDFLKEMQLIKNKYLDVTDAKLLKLITENIHTGLEPSTVRNYYYKN